MAGMSELSTPTGREEALRAVPRADGSAPRALVLGATGYIGGRLVPRLIAAGYRVRVLARDPARLAAFDWGDEVEVVAGAAVDGPALARACDDVDVLFYLIHSMSAGAGFEEADLAAARAVATAAAAASVGRIVYLGGLHPDGVPLSPHLRSRVEVGDVFLRSGVPTLVLQAGVVIGSGSASFEMIRHLTEVLPYMPAPKWVRNFIQPIAVRDVMYYLLGAARVAPEVNRAVDIGGPDVLRYGQMMNGYAVEAGLPQRPIAPLPVLTPGLASHWVNVVTPVPRSIARPLIASLQNVCVMDDHDIDAIIPPPEGGLTPYRRAVALALGGVGLVRGRRNRTRVAVGDVIDFWRVEKVEPGRLLRLRAEMKVPGLAWLDLGCEPGADGGAVYRQRAVFFPSGLSGRLYWLAVLPFHGFIFRGMANRITAAAEAAQPAA